VEVVAGLPNKLVPAVVGVVVVAVVEDEPNGVGEPKADVVVVDGFPNKVVFPKVGCATLISFGVVEPKTQI
jgi:hypothetical protein